MTNQIGGAFGLAFDTAGTLWVASTWGNALSPKGAIYKILAPGSSSPRVFSAGLTNVNDPRYLLFHQGKLYVSNNAGQAWDIPYFSYGYIECYLNGVDLGNIAH